MLLAQVVDPGVGLGPDVASLTPRALITTVIVVGVLALAAWALRRSMGSGRAGGKRVAIETAVSLGERRSLVIVTVEGRRLLLGVAPGHINLVTELDADDRFGQSLDASLSRGGVS
jgi:flagellar protein FliO/FliZ